MCITVKDCTSVDNRLYCIDAGNGCTITGNTTYDNGNKNLIYETGCVLGANYAP